MAAGKNKLLLYSRLILDGYDLSGDSRNLASLDNSFGQVPMSGWSEQIRAYMQDLVRTVGLHGYRAFMNDTALSGAYTLLKNPAGGHELSFMLGGGAAPTYGDLAYVLSGVQIQDRGSFEEQAAVLDADFLPEAGITHANPWGRVLFNHSLSVTTNGTSFNFGAASVGGGYQANLHILSTASGNFVFKVQHSVNDSTWVDLITFTINGSAVASEHQASLTGVVNQYVRGLATRTAGTVLAVMTFARNP